MSSSPGDGAAGGCAGICVVSARGSTEPQEGSRLLKPVGREIAARLPVRACYEELAYPATFECFEASYPARFDLGESPAKGVAALVGLLNRSAEECPGRLYVLLGYSQGAQVVGDALVRPEERLAGQGAGGLSPEAAEGIAAVVLYGNPRFTADEPFNAGTFEPGAEGVSPRKRGALAAYADRLRDYCAADDLACQSTEKAHVPAHVSYFSNRMPRDGAEFAVRRVEARLRGPTEGARSLRRRLGSTFNPPVTQPSPGLYKLNLMRHTDTGGGDEVRSDLGRPL